MTGMTVSATYDTDDITDVGVWFGSLSTQTGTPTLIRQDSLTNNQIGQTYGPTDAQDQGLAIQVLDVNVIPAILDAARTAGFVVTVRPTTCSDCGHSGFSHWSDLNHAHASGACRECDWRVQV